MSIGCVLLSNANVRGCGFADWILLHLLFAIKSSCAVHTPCKSTCNSNITNLLVLCHLPLLPSFKNWAYIFPKLNLEEDGPLALPGHKICAQEWCKSSGEKKSLPASLRFPESDVLTPSCRHEKETSKHGCVVLNQRHENDFPRDNLWEISHFCASRTKFCYMKSILETWKTIGFL